MYGSVMILLVERNHSVEGLMVMTFGGCPSFTQDPQGKPLCLSAPFYGNRMFTTWGSDPAEIQKENHSSKLTLNLQQWILVDWPSVVRHLATAGISLYAFSRQDAMWICCHGIRM